MISRITKGKKLDGTLKKKERDFSFVDDEFEVLKRMIEKNSIDDSIFGKICETENCVTDDARSDVSYDIYTDMDSELSFPDSVSTNPLFSPNSKEKKPKVEILFDDHIKSNNSSNHSSPENIKWKSRVRDYSNHSTPTKNEPNENQSTQKRERKRIVTRKKNSKNKKKNNFGSGVKQSFIKARNSLFNIFKKK